MDKFYFRDCERLSVDLAYILLCLVPTLLFYISEFEGEDDIDAKASETFYQFLNVMPVELLAVAIIPPDKAWVYNYFIFFCKFSFFLSQPSFVVLEREADEFNDTTAHWALRVRSYHH